MNPRTLMAWFCFISGILVLVGIVYCIFGLHILPVDKSVLIPWGSAIYGAIMIGWGTTLFLVGRLAFHRNDSELMKMMLYGIFIWLLIEALFSAYLFVFFNVGVDVTVFVLFSLPLIWVIKILKGDQKFVESK